MSWSIFWSFWLLDSLSLFLASLFALKELVLIIVMRKETLNYQFELVAMI